MRFHGREIDPVSFWESYVDFPARMDMDEAFSDLVYCPNPSHDNSQTPAFQVNLREPLVHCFSQCGISGTFEHAVCVVEGLYDHFKVEEAPTKQERIRRTNRAKREAKKLILKGARPGVRRSVISKIQRPKTVVLDYERFLPPVAVEYLEWRGINENSISLWEIGWDKREKRIVIPAHDEHGRMKFLIKRAVSKSQQPKYLYSEDATKTDYLFGADKLSNSANVVLVEGSLDVIRLMQHGLTAAAILGTGISQRQIQILARRRPRRIYLMFDRDIAGVRNIEIAIQKLKKYPLFVCRYPEGKLDPAELSRREALAAVERAVPAPLWLRSLQKPRKIRA